MASAVEQTLHASCILVGEAGVLIRGRSGAGKSTLARLLIDHVTGTGGFARLVSDDRVRVHAHNQRIVAHAVPAIAGFCEVRGLGIMPMAYEPCACLRLVVDLVDTLPARLPDEASRMVPLLGCELPHLSLKVGDAEPQVIILALAALHNRYDLT